MDSTYLSKSYDFRVRILISLLPKRNTELAVSPLKLSESVPANRFWLNSPSWKRGTTPSLAMAEVAEIGGASRFSRALLLAIGLPALAGGLRAFDCEPGP